MPPLANILRWVYDRRANRYRDLRTGRFVSATQVRDWAQKAIDASADRVTTLAEMIASDRLTVTDWERAMRAEIKSEYVQQYLAGRGGVNMMTQADWGSIGGMLADQYRYLSGFARAIAAGNLSEKQIAARARMYVNSAREAYERAHERSSVEAGMVYVHWNVDAQAENCNDCLDFQALGWRRLDSNPYGGAYPGSGHTECLTNCHCWWTFLRQLP